MSAIIQQALAKLAMPKEIQDIVSIREFSSYADLKHAVLQIVAAKLAETAFEIQPATIHVIGKGKGGGKFKGKDKSKLKGKLGKDKGAAVVNDAPTN